MTDRRGVVTADEQSVVAVDVHRLASIMAHVLDDERVPPDAHVALTLVDEDQIAQLNEQYLGGTGPTDVLAFPIDGGSGLPDRDARNVDAPPAMLGDVIVCPAVAARQAADQAGSTEAELELLVVHGTLHLLDYDHADPSDAAAMERREQELLRAHGSAEPMKGA